MNSEEIPKAYSQLQRLIQVLQEAGVELPANIAALLQTAGFSMDDILFDKSQKPTSASLAHQESIAQPTPSSLQSYLDSLSKIAVVKDEFTVTPMDRGGQIAGKGFEFQDIYAVFLMTKFLDENITAKLIRIEGVEDVDLLTQQGRNVCEWYYQIKTISEGHNWTLRMFDTEGVWRRFAHCVSEFRTKCSDPTRSIRVVLVVDGDISNELQPLKDSPETFAISGRADGEWRVDSTMLAEIRGEALASITQSYLQTYYSDNMGDGLNEVNSNLRSQSFKQKLRQLSRELVDLIDNGLAASQQGPEEKIVADLIVKSIIQTSNHTQDSKQSDNLYTLTAELINPLIAIAPLIDHLEALRLCLTEAYLLLDFLFMSLQIESRIGFTIRSTVNELEIADSEIPDDFSIEPDNISSTVSEWHSYVEEAIQLKLIGGSTLSPEQAKLIYNDLKKFARRAAQTGALIDRVGFFGITSSVPRIQLETIPDIANLIRRPDLTSDIIEKFNSQPVQYLYGFSKIGKTNLAALVAHELLATYSVFWHTFEAGTGCAERLISDFTFFIGELTNSRNLYFDWHEKKHSFSTIAEAMIATLADHSVLIVLDNCHVLDNGQKRTISNLLQAVISAMEADVKILMVGEDRSSLPSYVSMDASMRVGGLLFKETIALLKANDCLVTEDCMLDFLSLHSKIDGHPLMLLIVANQLGKKPSAQAVSALAANIADLNQDTTLFFDQLAHQVFNLLTTNEQKEMLRRLSVLHFGFDKELCFALAKCEPTLNFRESDWRRLNARVLDRSYRNKYFVPKILDHIASEDVSSNLTTRLYEAAAEHIIDTATKERKVDFWDFQAAIFYLGYAEKWEDAARYFLGGLASNPSATYEQLRPLYIIFRGPAFQASNTDPFLRSAIASNEFGKLVFESSATDYRPNTMLEVLKQMRLTALAIQDDELRTVQMCGYYLATSALYGQLILSQSTGKTSHSTLRRKSPEVANCSKRCLWRARKAFKWAVLSEELELIQAAFWSLLHANDLAIVPSPEEVPQFVDKTLETLNDLTEPAQSKLWQITNFWEAIFDTYLRYTINYPDEDTVFSLLTDHLEFAKNRKLTRLEVIIRHAIAYWYLERGKEFERTVEICDENLITVEQLHNNTQILKEVYVLRADSEFILKDYESARTDYVQAINLLPKSGPLDPLDIIAQYKVGDCCWYLQNYRAAAAAYLNALKMRGRVTDYDHSNSFQLFGKLSLAYLSMGFYWNAVHLHEKMFSIYERFQKDTMLVRLGGSLLGTSKEVPGSSLGDLDEIHKGQFANPKYMGPQFYDAQIRSEGLHVWLGRNSTASFRYMLAQAYDFVGDSNNAIIQAEISLKSDPTSNYIPVPVQRMLTYILLSRLHLQNNNKLASAQTIFEAIALSEEYLASQLTPQSLEGEILTEDYLAEFEALKETHQNAVPWEYAQHLFRHYIEPATLKEINKPQQFEDQATYFLFLVNLAVKLPPAVRPCIEALTQLYLGIFYVSRGYDNESEIAFTRMNELVLKHDLLYVELAYLLHTTFSAGLLLYPSAGDLTGACVETALRLITRLPDSQFILDDYSRQFTTMWGKKITFPSDTPLLEAKNRLTERIQGFINAILDVSERFFHVCAVLLLWVQETEFWTDNALALHQEILPQPLEYLKTDDLFKLYDEFGAFTREEAQHYILADGNVERSQKLSKTLYDIISFAIERYRDRLSSTQLAKLQEHQNTAKVWLG